MTNKFTTKSVTTIILLLASKPCFSEGQGGMDVFFNWLYFFSFIFYTLIGGFLIIIIRKQLGYINKTTTITFSFLIALILAFIFFKLDDLHFIPFFWFM